MTHRPSVHRTCLALIGLSLTGSVLAQSTGASMTGATSTTATSAISGTSAQAGGPPAGGGVPTGVFYTAHIKAVTAITEVFGDGQRTTAAAVEYDTPIRNSSLSKAAFTVSGRTVSRVYANNSAKKTTTGKDGRFVIIELTAPAASTASSMSGFGQSGLSVNVNQTVAVRTVAGAAYAPTVKTVESTQFSNLIVDDFQQFKYTDPVTGLVLDYNLYIPKGYNPAKKYPLVLFMPDASATSTNPYTTLTQGLGAVVWASPVDQAKHPAFVLAPQFTGAVANDDSQASAYLDVTVRLLHSLTSRYHVDTQRLYTTGQSAGCLMSIAMNIKYPKLFAASFLVAGQWDATLVAPMANDKLWIVVSQEDAKAYPGMNAITAALEKHGATVTRAVWDGTASATQFKADVAALLKEGPSSNVHYVAFKTGTVIPAGGSTQGAAAHMNTWRIAYTIEGIRDWLFAQRQ